MDVMYFIRTVLLLKSARKQQLLRLKEVRKLVSSDEPVLVVPNQPLDHQSHVRGRCWPIDIDFNLHMNNGRYLREADFGRFKLTLSTGLWFAIVERRKREQSQNINLVLGGIDIKYKRSIGLWETFDIYTRLSYWDDRSFYFEQVFVLDEKQKNKEPKIICCTILSKLTTVGQTRDGEKLSPLMLLKDLGYKTLKIPEHESKHIELFRLNQRAFKPIVNKQGQIVSKL
ncbi:unnamed protein product [Didymodactylos carnosus]|uniref:Protein THEM6 n=1 Tax=Didymodactylos carnosus TaxID=1234261 RepID=A0A8S2DQP9_9BILA|nr:unnamed protein product [Didymodactylos carnosus]CAF3798708.1 unnamed protein product [Didymodactylos carnosus]